MKTKFLTILLLAASVVMGAIDTTIQAGNFIDNSTWKDGSAPTNSDNILLNHAVTFTVSDTVGSSPANTTIWAIQLGSGGRIILNDNVKLTVRGNIDLSTPGSAGNIVNSIYHSGSGAKILFDTTLSGAATQYVIKGGRYNRIYLHGTRTTPDTITALHLWAMTEVAYFNSCTFDLKNVVIRKCEDNSGTGITSYVSSTGNPLSVIDSCIFDSCGQLILGINTSSTGARYTFTNNLVYNHRNTGATSIQFAGDAGDTMYVANNAITANVAFYPATNAIVTGNYIAGSLTATGVNTNWLTQDRKALVWKNNFIKNTSGSPQFEGNFYRTYFFGDHNTANSSTMIWLAYGPEGTRREAAGNIFEVTNRGIVGDLIFPACTTSRYQTFRNNILLPNSGGEAPAKILSFLNRNAVVDILNNTICTGGRGTAEETGIGVGENNFGNAGEVNRYRNNLSFTKTGKVAGIFFSRQQSNKQDFVWADSANYNWGFNQQEDSTYFVWSGYRDQPFFSTGTPDLNGGFCDPGFKNYSRNVATFDRYGLNNRCPNAWATGTVYAVGDTVHIAVDTIYGGDTINFRCITAHTSAVGNTTTGLPGLDATTNWRNTWEFNSVYKLRTDVSKIPQVIGWVQAGLKPSNTVLRASGWNSADIGAVPFILHRLDTIKSNDTMKIIDSISGGYALGDTSNGYRDSFYVQSLIKTNGEFTPQGTPKLTIVGDRCTTIVKLSAADTIKTLAYGSEQLGGIYFSDTLPQITTTHSTVPVITVEPTDQTVDENHTATFSLTATGADSYQWKSKANGNVGTSSNTYAFTATLADDGDSIWCIVSNEYGADTSDTVGLTVNDTIIEPIAITVQPQNMTFPYGAYTDTFVYMTSNAIHYNWNRNGEWLNTDNDTLTFEAHSGMDGWLVFGYAYTGNDTAWTDTITLTEANAPPIVTVDPVSDTTTSTVRMFAEWTGDSVQVAWYRFHNSDTILMSRDSVLQFTANSSMHGDSLAAVLYNNAGTVMTAKAGVYFVYAVFDSVNTADSNKIYVHGNFLSGTGWTATLSDSTLTTESGSATAQVFGYNHKITLSVVKYTLVITNGDYTVTLYIGRRKSTGNNKPRISIDIGL